MPEVINPIVILVSTALLAGTGANVFSLKAAHNTTVELTCIAPNDALFPPAWVMNGSFVLSKDGYRSSRDEDTGELIGTLLINGNHTCGKFHAYCRLSGGPIRHNTILTVEGCLPSPENIQINETNDFFYITWNPPYSTFNAESTVIHVDPYITHYTLYIIDSYTGNYMDKINVTETSFIKVTTDEQMCPIYCVTAWNSGGEGDMSVPLPHIPKSIATDDVDIHREPGALDIHFNVTDPCTARISSFFLVTVMSFDGVIKTTVQHQHPVATIHIVLPQNVEKCNLIVSISVGNSAGMSSPTEITVGCQISGHNTTTTPTIMSTGSDTTLTESVTTLTGSDTTLTGSVTTLTGLFDQKAQGDDIITYIAVGIAVGAVVIVATAALLLIVLGKCRPRRNTRERGEVVMHHNQAYETVSGMNHSNPVTKVPTAPCPAYGVVTVLP